MNSNPFAPATPTAPAIPTPSSGYVVSTPCNPHDASPEVPSSERRFGCSPGACWLRKAVVLATVIIALFSFVAREVTHSKEQYRMSRLVAHSEASSRLALERQRLGEVREARLQAAHLRQAMAAKSVQVVKWDTRRQGRRTAPIQLASR